MKAETYLNYIGGEWLQSSAAKWDLNLNPANPSEVLGKSAQSTPQDMTNAIETAASVQEKWRSLPRPHRGAFLTQVATILRSKTETIAKLITQEEGKNLTEARAEIQRTIACLEFTASESKRPVGDMLSSEQPGTLIHTVRSPLGVVGIITPWNFPLCIPAWKIGPALLEGNTVVFKPSSFTPATSVELVKAFEEAKLPPGVLNLVFGDGPELGSILTHSPKIKAISFTGSTQVGKIIYAQAAKNLTKVQLEMGGKNPMIVLADAELNKAAQDASSGAFGSTGQRCTATSRVIVERSIIKQFTEKLLQHAQAIRVGDGLNDPQAMGPLVNEKQYHSVLSAIEAAKKEGAKLLYGGEPYPNKEGGYFIKPTIFTDVTSDMTLAKEEIFGPVLAVMEVENFDEALHVANAVDYGLSSSLYTKNIQIMMRYVNEMQAGMLHINSPTVGGEVHAPFGGVKASGLGGREQGHTGPEFFCEIKTVYLA